MRIERGGDARRDEWQREVVHLTDVRLLVPALAGWALLALTLTWATGPRWLVARRCWASRAVGCPPSAGPWWPGGARARRGAARSRWRAAASTPCVPSATWTTLTAARAVVTLEATVTSDPVALPARGSGEPVVMVRAAAHEVTGRGRTTPRIRTRSPCAGTMRSWTCGGTTACGSADGWRRRSRAAPRWRCCGSRAMRSPRRPGRWSRGSPSTCGRGCAARSTPLRPTPAGCCPGSSSATPAAPRPTSPRRCRRRA